MTRLGAPSNPHVLRFSATLTGFSDASIELRQLLDGRNLPAPVSYNVELAFEEIVTNIIRHGGPSGDIVVTIGFDGRIVLTFEDDGVPFDPRDRLNKLPPTSLNEAAGGGLGLLLINKIASQLDYKRTPGHNLLTVSIPADSSGEQPGGPR